MKRSNVLIIDEYVMVDKDIIDTVLRRFQSNPRHVGYIEKEPYKSMSKAEKLEHMDRNQELYLSSAFFKSHESWDRVVDYANNMVAGRPYFVCQLPYQLPIKDGLLDPRQVQDEMSEASFDEIRWTMEMEALFYGQSMDSYFQTEEILKNRTLQKAYYPKSVTSVVKDKSIEPPKKQAGELRVISNDIATIAGEDNDASIYTIARLIPDNSGGYERQTMYMEDVVGGHTETQAVRIRELYEDFNCDYIVLDVRNAGIGVYDAMTRELINQNTGDIYPPVSCLNNEKLAERCAARNAKKVVFAISAYDALNAQIAAGFKDSMRKEKFKFLVNEQDALDVLTGIKGYNNLDPETKAMLKAPYVQINMMQNETLNLQKEITQSGLVRLQEPRSGRKDRYTAISYLDYFVTEYLEIKNRKNNQTTKKEAFNFFMGKKAKLY